MISSKDKTDPIPPIQIFYDGGCPYCSLNMTWLRLLDRKQGRITIIDITASDFHKEDYSVDKTPLMSSIHAKLPDGRILEGIEAFRHVYEEMGFGWMLAPTNWPVLGEVIDKVYRWFARNRYALSFRKQPPLCAGDCTINNTKDTQSNS